MTNTIPTAMEEGRNRQNPTSVVPGVSPQLYSLADFEQIARLVHAEAGIVLTKRKAMLAYSRLAPLVRQSGAERFETFLNRLDDDPALKTRTISALTTNHTYFNREPHHYEHFQSEVRPALVARAEQRQAVRLWSAGCSSGEEVWTLMMVLLGNDRQAGEALARRDIVALASDLADHAVKSAQEGRYPAEALDSVPKELRAAWCQRDENSLVVGPSLRRMVRFRQLNLIRPWPFEGLFDVIFCRNVMIYFDDPTKERLVLRLAQRLKPGGFLYIGHSERVTGEASALLRCVGPTIYQRVGAGA
ncbi:MAG: protein-glutamate O-methyltransferase CheR [Erythrobacter sp.]|uniref:CheR family methyltransferase n=1 Tax=Erythrobacter sp. TaxID=1042 RepID=UPI00262AA2DD|nr:protein-glutamate O-methyltransferase CheR [Erythrobacter sp.]MDJ0977119.1 protein-glutamate O-methyltransferase CheR [Erythrobacter sp.]